MLYTTGYLKSNVRVHGYGEHLEHWAQVTKQMSEQMQKKMVQTQRFSVLAGCGTDHLS